MSRNNTNSYDLTTTAHTQRPLAYSQPNGGLTRAQREVVRRANLQLLIEEATAAKTDYGLTLMDGLQVRGAMAFSETLAITQAITEAEGRTQRYQQHIDEYAELAIERTKHHNLHAVDAACAQIVGEILTPLHQDEYPPTLAERLFGT